MSHTEENSINAERINAIAAAAAANATTTAMTHSLTPVQAAVAVTNGTTWPMIYFSAVGLRTKHTALPKAAENVRTSLHTSKSTFTDIQNKIG